MFFDTAIGICWVVFILYWVINARGVKVVAEKQSVWSGLSHRIPLGCSYFLLAGFRLPPPLNQTMTSHSDWVRTVGVSVCVLGLFVTLWARGTLGGNWSSAVTFKGGHELIKGGPYRLVRHPIYTELLMSHSSS